MNTKIVPYSSDPFTKTYGTQKVQELLTQRHGEKYIKYRQDWEKAGPNHIPTFPLNLVLDLIDVCNLSCPQCLRAPDLIKEYGGYIGTLKKLSSNKIFEILEECRENNLPSLNIGGSGECTLHPDFLPIVQKAIDIGVCELRIISNGIKLKPELSKELIKLKPHIVSISIDGFSKESFGKTRGKEERYQEVVENVCRFSEIKKQMNAVWPILRVSFVEQSANYLERNDFINFWSKYADMIEVQTYHNYRQDESFNTKFDCFEPFKRLTLWAYGGAGPCCGFTGIVYNVGDFSKKSLKQIWAGPEIEKIRQMATLKNWQLPCLKCQGTRTVI